MRGDSECSTGQPMMPTSFVAPEIVVIGSQYLPATQPCSTHNAYASHTPRSSRSSRLVRSWLDDPPRDAEAVVASTRRRSSRRPRSRRRSQRSRQRAAQQRLRAPRPFLRTGRTTAASTASTTSRATETPSTRSRTTSATTRTQRTSSPGRSRGRRAASSRSARRRGGRRSIRAPDHCAARERLVAVLRPRSAPRSRGHVSGAARGRRSRVRGSPSPGACGRRLTATARRQQPP